MGPQHTTLNNDQSYFSRVMSFSTNGISRITGLMVCAEAGIMVSDLALRAMRQTVELSGFRFEENGLVKAFSGDILGAPVRQFAHLATGELAKRALVFTVAGLALFQIADYFCGKTPTIYNRVIRFVSPLELSTETVVERWKKAFDDAKTAFNETIEGQHKPSWDLLRNAALAGPTAVFGLMAGLEALKMYGEGAIRVLSLIPTQLGLDMSKNVYLKDVSGEIMGAPIRNYRHVLATDLAKRAVVFSAISFGLLFAAKIFRGETTPGYYNTFLGMASPFQLTNVPWKQNIDDAQKDLAASYRALTTKSEKKN